VLRGVNASGFGNRDLSFVSTYSSSDLVPARYSKRIRVYTVTFSLPGYSEKDWGTLVPGLTLNNVKY
jgi:hypothetical protein